MIGLTPVDVYASPASRMLAVTHHANRFHTELAAGQVDLTRGATATDPVAHR